MAIDQRETKENLREHLQEQGFEVFTFGGFEINISFCVTFYFSQSFHTGPILIKNTLVLVKQLMTCLRFKAGMRLML